MRLLHKMFAIFVVPALGYLLGATIFNLCWDMAEPGNLAEARFVAVAKSCERHGPVAWRGFGYYYKCQTEVTNTSTGGTRMWTTTGWLEPADVGEQFTVKWPRNANQPHPVERPYQGLGGVLAMVFGVLWIFVLAWVANPLLEGYPERLRERRLARQQENPMDFEDESRVLVMGGKAWIPLRYQFLILLVCGVGVYASVRGAFEGDTSDVVLAVACLAVSLLIAGGLVRRFLTFPSVCITAEGLEWNGRKLSWAEIGRVHLSQKNVLSVQPRGGEAVHIGPFGDRQASEIHDAMTRFGQAPYAREQGKQLPTQFL